MEKEFELYDEEKESASLNPENLTELGFVLSTKHDVESESVYELEDFEVILDSNKDEENPEVSLYQHTTRVIFPGAYRLKDLKALLFFYYAEDKYSELVHGIK